MLKEIVDKCRCSILTGYGQNSRMKAEATFSISKESPMRKPTQLNGTFQFNANIGSKFRVHPRAEMDGEVIIHDENRLYISSLNNISAGGLFVDHLTSIAQGRTVRVVIRSPRFREPVQAQGTVVRIEDAIVRRGIAIEFTKLSSEAKTAIQQCVSETRMESALKAA